MTYEVLVRMLGEQGVFDLASVVLLSGERRPSLLVQLHRWCKAGRLLPLRRGMYAFPRQYAGQAISPAELANRLYAPSYLSTYWALGYYGLIPERVVEFTCVTSRAPQTFSNALGVFRYQHVKAGAFFGYRPVDIGGHRVLLAEPEKALVDLWYLGKGVWTPARIAEMRFQSGATVHRRRLRQYAARLGAPRLLAAAKEWERGVDSEAEGTVSL